LNGDESDGYEDFDDVADPDFMVDRRKMDGPGTKFCN
jgi:hypothetical protein